MSRAMAQIVVGWNELETQNFITLNGVQVLLKKVQLS